MKICVANARQVPRLSKFRITQLATRAGGTCILMTVLIFTIATQVSGVL